VDNLIKLWIGMLVFSLVSCAYHSSSVQTGKVIEKNKVDTIVKGKTTGGAILTSFGAPTKTSRLGKEELFVYKYCITEGSAGGVVGISGSSAKEMCDELSIVLDENGIVKDYGFVQNVKN
jgi:hypothetical protein